MVIAHLPAHPYLFRRRKEVVSAMHVWVWDAINPGNMGGVCGEEARAREVVSEFLAGGRATTAIVELASLVLGGGGFETCYERMGRGWTARRNRNGRIMWRRLEDSRSRSCG